MGFDDTRDRALFEDSAMSSSPRCRIVCAGYCKPLNIRKYPYSCFQRRGHGAVSARLGLWSNGIKKFMAEKGIQPDLITPRKKPMRHSIWNIWGSRRCGRSEAYLYEYQRCADPRKPVRYWEYIPTEVKPFFVRTVASLAASRAVNPPW